MTDAELAHVFIVAADALDATTQEPQGEQTPNEYIRNDAFRTISRAFRQEAAKLQPAPEPAGDTCCWCGQRIRPGTATVRQPRPVDTLVVVDSYHADCWDKRLRAEA